MHTSHIRGWLGVFVAYAALDSFGSLRACASMLRITGTEEPHQFFFEAALVQNIELALFVASLIGLVRILKKHPKSRRYWLILLAGKIPAEFVAYAMASGIAVSYAEAIGSAKPDLGPYAARFMWQSAIVLAWLAYWARSRRIRETFGPQSAPAALGAEAG